MDSGATVDGGWRPEAICPNFATLLADDAWYIRTYNCTQRIAVGALLSPGFRTRGDLIEALIKFHAVRFYTATST